MKNNVQADSKNRKSSIFNLLCVALFLGSIWGFFEVVFKDALAMGGQPLTAALMTGLGVFIMSVGYRIFKNAGIFLMISLFTIMARMVIVPVLGCSPICRANAVVALLILGTSSTLAFGLSSRYIKNTAKWGGGVAGAAVLVSGVSFYYAGLACAPCPYLLQLSVGGLSNFMAMEVVYWALFSGILFYPGYQLGRYAQAFFSSLRINRPAFYYTGLLAASALFVLSTGLIVLT